MEYSGFKIKKALGIVNKFPPVPWRGKSVDIALHNTEGVTLRALVPGDGAPQGIVAACAWAGRRAPGAVDLLPPGWDT